MTDTIYATVNNDGCKSPAVSTSRDESELTPFANVKDAYEALMASDAEAKVLKINLSTTN